MKCPRHQLPLARGSRQLLIGFLRYLPEPPGLRTRGSASPVGRGAGKDSGAGPRVLSAAQPPRRGGPGAGSPGEARAEDPAHRPRRRRRLRGRRAARGAAAPARGAGPLRRRGLHRQVSPQRDLRRGGRRGGEGRQRRAERSSPRGSTGASLACDAPGAERGQGDPRASPGSGESWHPHCPRLLNRISWGWRRPPGSGWRSPRTVAGWEPAVGQELAGCARCRAWSASHPQGCPGSVDEAAPPGTPVPGSFRWFPGQR